MGNNKQLLSLLSSEKTKTTTKKFPKKNRIKFPEKKIPNPATTTQNNPKKSLNNKKKICHTPQFFLQVMNKILVRKKNNQKTKQEKEIMFLFLTPRFRTKRLQLSCKSKETQKASKTKILQKNPMKYTHKKVELKKKKSSEKKTTTTFFLFAVQQLVKLT